MLDFVVHSMRDVVLSLYKKVFKYCRCFNWLFGQS